MMKNKITFGIIAMFVIVGLLAFAVAIPKNEQLEKYLEKKFTDRLKEKGINNPEYYVGECDDEKCKGRLYNVVGKTTDEENNETNITNFNLEFKIKKEKTSVTLDKTTKKITKQKVQKTNSEIENEAQSRAKFILEGIARQ